MLSKESVKREKLQLGGKSKPQLRLLEIQCSFFGSFLNRVKDADTPEVPIIVKADTQGSVEAVTEAIMKLNSVKVRNRVVHKAVGGINESDLPLAETSGAVVVAFNVRAARGLDEEGEAWSSG